MINNGYRGASKPWENEHLPNPLDVDECLAPLPVANAAIQIENRDLGVLTDLHDALDVRGGLLTDDGESASAESAMASVDAAIRPSGAYDALSLSDNPMSDASFKQIDIQPVDHQIHLILF